METTYGLNKLTVKIFGEDVRSIIQKIPFMTYSVHSFMMCVKDDEVWKKSLKFCFELKESLSFIELGLIHKEFSANIVKELHHLNRDFVGILKDFSFINKPEVEFYSFGHGPFLSKDNGIKSFSINQI